MARWRHLALLRAWPWSIVISCNRPGPFHFVSITNASRPPPISPALQPPVSDHHGQIAPGTSNVGSPGEGMFEEKVQNLLRGARLLGVGIFVVAIATEESKVFRSRDTGSIIAFVRPNSSPDELIGLLRPFLPRDLLDEIERR
jgi:hypothetical protein